MQKDTTGMRLLKFSADWCVPCRKLEESLKDFTLLPMAEVDVVENDDLVKAYKVMSIPTLVLVDADGAELWRRCGTIDTERLTEALKPFIGSCTQ